MEKKMQAAMLVNRMDKTMEHEMEALGYARGFGVLGLAEKEVRILGWALNPQP